MIKRILQIWLIKVKDLEVERFCWIIWVDLMYSQGSLKEGVRKIIVKERRRKDRSRGLQQANTLMTVVRHGFINPKLQL